MIKICFISTVSLTLKVFLLNVAKYLHDTGEFDIYMICNPDKSFEDSLPNYITFLPVEMKRGFGTDGLRAIKRLKKIFKEYRFDIVQYSTPNASCYASIAAKKAKVPVRLYCQWGIAYVGYTGIKRRILKLVEKHTCKCSTWIEPDSKSNLDFAHKERLYPSHVGSVVWNGSACGVDLKKFDFKKKQLYRDAIRRELKIPDNSFVYGFVGRITKDKGINELLEAFKTLVSGNRDVYLLLLGNVEKEEMLDSSLFEWSKNTDKVIYCGYSNNAEKFLSSMDCYILPSYREGFGMGVVEAEAMGVPVVVTNIPGPIDAMIDNETGIVVEKKDVSSLYKAMLYYFDNKGIAFQHGIRGVSHASECFNSELFLGFLYQDRLRLLKKSKK